jgi:hypothetical protein
VPIRAISSLNPVEGNARLVLCVFNGGSYNQRVTLPYRRRAMRKPDQVNGLAVMFWGRVCGVLRRVQERPRTVANRTAD